jgi:glycerol-3-phosphate cytidylyltransferase
MKRGVTFGAFDLCHAGHVIMFEECKRHCDYLIVGLQVDPSLERNTKNSPVQSLFERYVQLKAIKYVDEIIPYVYEHEILEILSAAHIDVRIIGEDYLNKEFTGLSLCNELGIELVYNKRQHNFSSSELRLRVEKNVAERNGKDK